MKRAGICLRMMIKRMGKHPVYWVLLMLFPAALFIVPEFNRAAGEELISVGYVMAAIDDGPMAENEVIEGERAEDQEIAKDAEAEEGVGREFSEEEEYTGQLLSGMEYVLQEKAADSKSLFDYIKYSDKDTMTKDIETGEITCGVVFNAEFSEKLKEQDYYHCITLYLPEGMNVGGMVQEDLFGKVYQAYSAVWYAELLEQQGYGVKPEEVLRKFSEYQSEGKVFVVDYEVPDGMSAKLYHDPKAGNEISLLSLRGILAFLTLLSASLGALDGSRDRKRGAGKGMADGDALVWAAVGAPIVIATLFLAGGMIFNNIKMAVMSENGSRVEKMTGIVLSRLIQAGVLQELVSAFVYGLILWLFAVVLSRFVPEKLLEGAMPCFLLIVLLCCPVFFDLGETIPVVGYLSKVFPVTWYLSFWG